MQLKNKKTGEIVDFHDIQTDYVAPIVLTVRKDGFSKMYEYESLAKLMEEWEDYDNGGEEYYWCVDYISCGVDKLKYTPSDPAQDEFNRSIGNWFKTEKEAKEAVERLKALKRLSDKGFEVDSREICGEDFVCKFKLCNSNGYEESVDDFDCLLGFGEGE